MATETSIASKDVVSGSDVVCRVKRSTLERESGVSIWHQWQAHFCPVVEETDEKAELHIKHPYESSKKGYNRVKLEKVGTFPDEKFKHYKECIGTTKRQGEGIDSFTRYHEEGEYFSFTLETLFDIVEYLVQEGFKVSLTGNVIEAYQEKIIDG